MHSLLPSLNTLKICNCPDLESFPEASALLKRLASGANVKVLIPEKGFLPSTFTFLYIVEVPSLRSLNTKALRHLTSVKKLAISRCPQLQSMSGPELPEELSVDCPLLKERLQKDKGEDWSKVAFVPITEIDDEMIV
ncbi:hypothetical protein PTKIN_Ptkin11bG0097500 [Pterospermum kingtungense]